MVVAEFANFYDEWHFQFDLKILKTDPVETNLLFLSDRQRDVSSGGLGEIFSIAIVGGSSTLSFWWDETQQNHTFNFSSANFI